jgi:hypothetical protein
MVDAVSFFAVDRPGASRTVRARLLKRQGELLGHLPGARSWDDFKERVGVIRGLGEAIDICETIDKEERS